jgi:hypothetical protein
MDIVGPPGRGTSGGQALVSGRVGMSEYGRKINRHLHHAAANPLEKPASWVKYCGVAPFDFVSGEDKDNKISLIVVTLIVKQSAFASDLIQRYVHLFPLLFPTSI